jgi:predicted O-methyltransferase YrrM
MITPTKEFWEVFKETNGALSCCEAIAIMNLAAQAPNGLNGIFFEAGTYHGKSAMAASVGLPAGMFHLVDPIFEDQKLADTVSKTVYHMGDNLAGVVATNGSSIDEILKHDRYCYVFIDSGDHQELPMAEVKLIEDRVVQNGIVAFHDFNSQFLQVRDAYDYLLSTGKYEEVQIEWQQIVDYVGENNLEKGNTSWHHNELEFPCFVGALKRK